MYNFHTHRPIVFFAVCSFHTHRPTVFCAVCSFHTHRPIVFCAVYSLFYSLQCEVDWAVQKWLHCNSIAIDQCAALVVCCCCIVLHKSEPHGWLRTGAEKWDWFVWLVWLVGLVGLGRRLLCGGVTPISEHTVSRSSPQSSHSNQLSRPFDGIAEVQLFQGLSFGFRPILCNVTVTGRLRTSQLLVAWPIQSPRCRRCTKEPPTLRWIILNIPKVP